MDRKSTDNLEIAGHNESESGNSRSLRIDNFHYRANDLTELAKIADKHPDLAQRIIDQQDRADARENTSFRLGMGSAVLLVGMVLATVAYTLVNAGLWTLVGLVLFVLALALLIRVILTGEWSDTSWIGQALGGIARALGGKPNDLRSGDEGDPPANEVP